MILNRTVGGQKKYRITVDGVYKDFIILQKSSAQAGDFVGFSYTERHAFDLNDTIVETISGMSVPMFTVKQSGIEYPTSGRQFLSFVMPAEDVTIS